MRFASSFALFSLAGLGLATPVAAPDELAPRGGTGALGGLGGLGGLTSLTKGLGLGRRDHRKRDIRRRNAEEVEVVVDSNDSNGVLLRSREAAAETQAKDKPKPKSKSDSKSKGKDKSKSKGEGEGKSKSKGEGKGKDNGKEKGKGEGKGKCNGVRHTPCLHSDDVDVLVDAYQRMLSKWNDTDAKYLADSFRDSSDSINILAGFDLGKPTFPTKQAFIDHQHTQVRAPLETTSLRCNANI